eukprot:GEMP01026711.1.p1 GENE.GEMP01026711.1~~GEMP01026711.1.p1  ORF type:complete len:588 (+),score=122.81 GEMP01026711.1:117-1880(+)
MQKAKGRVVVLSDLHGAEKERFYQFLIANDVEFVLGNDGNYIAHIRVVPPVAPGATGQDSPRPSMPGDSGARWSSKDDLTLRDTRPTTTLSNSPMKYSESKTPPNQLETQKAMTQAYAKRYSAFCDLLQNTDHMPRARTLAQILRIVDEIYDARFIRDTTRIKMEANGEVFKLECQDDRFPLFVYQYFTKTYGLKRMANQTAWGLVSSIDRWRKVSPAVAMFAILFEESLSTKELLFFLFARNIVERQMNIAPCQRNNKRQFIMSANQQTQCLDEIFATHTELIERVQTLLSSNNVTLNSFLLTLTMEYHRTRTGSDVHDIVDSAKEKPQADEKDTEVALLVKRLYDVVGQKTTIEVGQVYAWAELLVKRKQELQKMQEYWDTLGGVEQPSATKTRIRLDEVEEVEKELQLATEKKKQDGQWQAQETYAKELDAIRKLPGELFRINLEPNIRTILRLKVNIMIKNSCPPETPAIVRMEASRDFVVIVDALVNATISQRQDLWCRELGIETCEVKAFQTIQDRLNHYVTKHTTAGNVEAFLDEILGVPEVDACARKVIAQIAANYQQLSEIHGLYLGGVQCRTLKSPT